VERRPRCFACSRTSSSRQHDIARLKQDIVVQRAPEPVIRVVRIVAIWMFRGRLLVQSHGIRFGPNFQTKEKRVTETPRLTLADRARSPNRCCGGIKFLPFLWRISAAPFRHQTHVCAKSRKATTMGSRAQCAVRCRLHMSSPASPECLGNSVARQIYPRCLSPRSGTPCRFSQRETRLFRPQS